MDLRKVDKGLLLDTEYQGKPNKEKMRDPKCSRGPRLILTCWATIMFLSITNATAHTGKYHPEDYREIPIRDPKCDTISVSYAEGQGSTSALVEVRYCIDWVYGDDPYDVFHQHARVYECGSRVALRLDVRQAKNALSAEKAIAYATYSLRAESSFSTLISDLAACAAEALDPEAEKGCTKKAWKAFENTAVDLMNDLVKKQAHAIVTCNTLIEVALSEHRGCDID